MSTVHMVLPRGTALPHRWRVQLSRGFMRKLLQQGRGRAEAERGTQRARLAQPILAGGSKHGAAARCCPPPLVAEEGESGAREACNLPARPRRAVGDMPSTSGDGGSKEERGRYAPCLSRTTATRHRRQTWCGRTAPPSPVVAGGSESGARAGRERHATCLSRRLWRAIAELGRHANFQIIEKFHQFTSCFKMRWYLDCSIRMSFQSTRLFSGL